MPLLYPRRCMISAAIAFVASWSVQAFAAEPDTVATPHPVQQQQPRDIVLERDASIWEAMVNSLTQPPGFWDMTVHQYTSKKKSLSRTSFLASVTGRSLTLRVEEEVLVTSVSAQSGDRIQIMARLFFEQGKLTMFNGTQSRDDRVIVNLSSTGPGPIDHNLSRTSPIYWTGEADLAAAKQGRLQAGLLGVAGYGGGRHCGFDVFYDSKFAKARNRNGPFARGNLFVKERVNQAPFVVSCNNDIAPAYCFAASNLAGWAPFEVSFTDKHLCDAEQVLEAGRDWLQSRIIREERPSISGQ